MIEDVPAGHEAAMCLSAARCAARSLVLLVVRSRIVPTNITDQQAVTGCHVADTTAVTNGNE